MHRDHTVTSEWHSDPVLYRQCFVLLFININLPFVLLSSITLLTTAFEKSFQKYFMKHKGKAQYIEYSSGGKNTSYAV